MYIVSDVLHDVKHIAQANAQKTSGAIQQYEIEQLLKEKEKQQQFIRSQKEMLKLNLKTLSSTINSNIQACGGIKAKGKSSSKGRKTGHGKVGAESAEPSARGSRESRTSKNSSRSKRTKSNVPKKTGLSGTSSSKTGTSLKQKSQGSAAQSKNELGKNVQSEDGFPIDSIKEDMDENMVTLE